MSTDIHTCTLFDDTRSGLLICHSVQKHAFSGNMNMC